MWIYNFEPTEWTRKSNTTYSIWPITLDMLNLPREVRYLFGRLLLGGIIPGNGTKEPYSLQPYLDILVDELLFLSGQQFYDSYKRSSFTMKCEIPSYVLDYPGVFKVLNSVCSGGYKACAWCEKQEKFSLNTCI